MSILFFVHSDSLRNSPTRDRRVNTEKVYKFFIVPARRHKSVLGAGARDNYLKYLRRVASYITWTNTRADDAKVGYENEQFGAYYDNYVRNTYEYVRSMVEILHFLIREKCEVIRGGMGIGIFKYTNMTRQQFKMRRKNRKNGESTSVGKRRSVSHSPCPPLMKIIITVVKFDFTQACSRTYCTRLPESN